MNLPFEGWPQILLRIFSESLLASFFYFPYLRIPALHGLPSTKTTHWSNLARESSAKFWNMFFCLQLNNKRTHLAWQQSFACLASRPPSVREIFRQRKKSWWQRPCHWTFKWRHRKNKYLFFLICGMILARVSTLFVAWKYPKPENIPRLTPGHGVSHSPFPTWQFCKSSLLRWQFS